MTVVTPLNAQKIDGEIEAVANQFDIGLCLTYFYVVKGCRNGAPLKLLIDCRSFS